MGDSDNGGEAMLQCNIRLFLTNMDNIGLENIR